MIICKTISELHKTLKNKDFIGFIPTMGALHKGHLSLLETSKKQTKTSVVSIFVNPKQFNNLQDFENYPIMLDDDLAKLKNQNCDVVFIPKVNEIFPPNLEIKCPIDISEFNTFMEGKYRPSHFEGVVKVVYRLFQIIQPQKAFFGEKDFQQLQLIKKLQNELQLPIEIVGVPTKRETNGLAMSSRNLNLNNQQLKEASLIYKTLYFCKKNYQNYSLKNLRVLIEKKFINSNLKLEYLEFFDTETTIPIKKWTESKSVSCCIAVYCDKVRLIDYLSIF